MKLKAWIKIKGCVKIILLNNEEDATLLLMRDNTIHVSNFLYLHCGPSA